MQRGVRLGVVVMMLGVLGGMRPVAAQTLYTTPESFAGATSGLTEVNFNELDASPVVNTHEGRTPFNGAHYAGLGITFSNPQGKNLYIAPDGLGWNTSNCLSVERFPFTPGDDDDDDLVITFSAPRVAAGFALVDAGAGLIQFLDASNAIIAQSTVHPFVGLTSAARPIASIRFVDDDNGDDVAFDDFRFGAAADLSAVPEPTSVLLFLPALAVTAFLKRRQSA